MAEYIDRNLIEWYGCNFEYDGCKNRECSDCSHAECSHSQVMQIPIADVIPIPEGATNGDMIKAVFNATEKYRYEGTDLNLVVVVIDGQAKCFDLDWRNAPYRKDAE